jgi:hypothetical protein
MTTATVTIWPTTAQLQRLAKQIERAYHTLDELQLEFVPLNPDDPEQLPSFEQLGRLTAFVEAVDQDLQVMREQFLGDIRRLRDEVAVRMADA